MSGTRGQTLIPSPNECNSTLTSATRGEMLTPQVQHGMGPLTNQYLCHCGIITN